MSEIINHLFLSFQIVFFLTTMSGNREEKGVKGGPSKLREMVLLKYPFLNQNEASDLILKTKEDHGGSLTGLKMGEILKSIKKLLIEKNKQTDNNHDNVEVREIPTKNENDKTFEKTCKFCYKIFLYPWTCRRHMQHTHGNSNKSGFIETKRKGKQSQGENVGNHKCTFCDKIFLYTQSLERHMIKHEEDPHVFKCKFCEKTFNRKDVRKRHEQTIHKSYQIDFTAAGLECPDSLKCNMCNKKFGKDKEKLFAHLAAKQCQSKTLKFNLDEEHRFKCNLCPKKYLDKNALLKHVNWKHTSKTKKFSCKFCTSEFQYKFTMAKHMKKFHGVDN